MAMAKQQLPQTLISIAALFLMLANMALSQTTRFRIERFRPNENRLTYDGDAFVPSGSSSLRLTKDEYSVGRVLYKTPLEFWGKDKQVKFETTIVFKITPASGSTPADGIVFFIAPDGSPIADGSTGGNFGIFDSTGNGNSVFAVEIDTFKNSWDPPKLDRHIGIDLNSRISSSVGSLLDSVVGKEVNLTVKYDVAKYTITAKAQVAGSNEYVQVSHKVDLSTVLDQKVQVGISASTGQAVSLQDIYYWDFTATMIHRGTVNGAGIRKVVSS